MSVLLFQKTINFQFFPQKAEPEKLTQETTEKITLMKNEFTLSVNKNPQTTQRTRMCRRTAVHYADK